MSDSAVPRSGDGTCEGSRLSRAFVADTPLVSPDQDRLGRSEFAKFLAEAITRADIREGFVFALYGEWGSGKSSTLNFVRHYVEASGAGDDAPIIVQFNPWWFSGREELLQQFFHQLTASLGKPGRLRRFGRWLAHGLLRAPRLLLWLAGTLVGGPEKLVIAGARYVIGRYADSLLGGDERLNVTEQRARVEQALAALDRRILVLVDDIDRLPAAEISDMFRVIKAVADFPNTIYLLAFDRTVVAKALDETGIPGERYGERYVEKIVQAGFDLPLPERVRLRGLLEEQLPAVLSGTPQELWDETHWYNLYLEGVDAFIRTPRDIKRYLNVLRPSYSVVRGEVNAADFLAIEAMRVFAAPVYYEIRAKPELFVGKAGRWSGMDNRPDAAAKDAFQAVLQAVENKSDRDAINALLKRLFPRYVQAPGGTIYGPEWEGVWFRQRRICSADVFSVYFRLSVPEGGLSKAEVDTLLSLTEDPTALIARLRELASEPGSGGAGSRAGEFLHHLPDYIREDIPEDHVEGLIQALHDAGDDLMRADDRQGPFQLRNEIQIVVITHQLLRRISDEPRRFEILSRVFRAAESIPLIVHQLHTLGQQRGRYGGMTAEGPDEDQLLSVQHVDDLETIVLGRIEDAAASGALRAIPQLGYVLHFWQALAGDEPARKHVDGLIASDEGVATFLEGFLAESYSQVLTDRVRQTHYQIQIPHIARLIDPDEIQPAAERIIAESPEWLSAPQRLAVEVFLSDLENKAGGYGPLETPD